MEDVYIPGKHKGRQVDVTVELPAPEPSKNRFAAKVGREFNPETEHLLRDIFRRR